MCPWVPLYMFISGGSIIFRNTQVRSVALLSASALLLIVGCWLLVVVVVVVVAVVVAGVVAIVANLDRPLLTSSVLMALSPKSGAFFGSKNLLWKQKSTNDTFGTSKNVNRKPQSVRIHVAGWQIIMFQPWDMSKYFGLVHLFYQLLLAHMANQSFFKKNTVLFTVFCQKIHVFFQKKHQVRRLPSEKKSTDPMNIPIPPARRYSLSWVKAKPGTKMPCRVGFQRFSQGEEFTSFVDLFFKV